MNIGPCATAPAPRICCGCMISGRSKTTRSGIAASFLAHRTGRIARIRGAAPLRARVATRRMNIGPCATRPATRRCCGWTTSGWSRATMSGIASCFCHPREPPHQPCSPMIGKCGVLSSPFHESSASGHQGSKYEKLLKSAPTASETVSVVR